MLSNYFIKTHRITCGEAVPGFIRAITTEVINEFYSNPKRFRKRTGGNET